MECCNPNPGLKYYYPIQSSKTAQKIVSDVCIYGGTSSGVVAAVQLARMGLKVVIAEFGRHLGGMTSSGLGATDIGNKSVIGGLARKFYRKLGRYYHTEEQWTFEPHVAETVFNDWIREYDIPVHFEQRLKKINKEGTQITELLMDDGTVYHAGIFIDATYEGDLMAMAEVSYATGREGNALYGETYNGIQYGGPYHNFCCYIDPYVEEGNPSKGLLCGISADEMGTNGLGDRCIQAYNFRICLTDNEDIKVPFSQPSGYDRSRYMLLLRYIEKDIFDALKLNTSIPNRKTDLNNYGGFSTDYIGANYGWPEGNYETREQIFQDHVCYTQGLLFFLANDSKVPLWVRDQVNKWGLPSDEFLETNHWPHQLYIREARRMISEYVMTEHNCFGKHIVDDPVGLAAYNIDSHNCRRIVYGGRVVNEGDVEIRLNPYPVSFRSIVPEHKECTNLLVPVCLSASHIAFGSIRMEPVFMVLGQSAATVAAIANERNCAVQDVPYNHLRKQLLNDNQILDKKLLA